MANCADEMERAASCKVSTIRGADLFCDIEPSARLTWRHLAPGLTVVTLGTLAAGFLSDRYGAPLTLMALLVGLSLNFLGADRKSAPGVDFASSSLLRFGIVLIGARVHIDQMIALGPVAMVAILGIVALAISAGIIAARVLGETIAFGALAGAAVGICGASAAMALATTLGARRANDGQLTLVLVGISAMSAGAMAIYPLVAHALNFTDLQAGFLLGASIHDVAQAVGAGYSYSPRAGEIAAIVKLTRVALLAPVLAIVAASLPRGSTGARGPTVPWFVAGFFAVAGVNSLGWIPARASDSANVIAVALLAAAVTATGIRAPITRLVAAGPRPLIIIFFATLLVFGAAVGGALLIG